MTKLQDNQTVNYEYCYVCCGKRFCYDTAGKRNKSQKQHNKTISHKISDAISNAWVEWQKRAKHLSSCGICGSDLTERRNCNG